MKLADIKVMLFMYITEKMAAWKNLFVPKKVLQALCENEFFSPTPIQAMALPSAIRDKKDIVGAAETVRKKYIFRVTGIQQMVPFPMPNTVDFSQC